MKFITHYTFKPELAQTGIDYSEVVTVPDLVLSMQEIYERYAVRGDISGLANNIRPHVSDDFELDDPLLDFDPEEDVDILQHSRELRMRQHFKAHPALEDKPQDKKEDTDVSSPKPQPDAGSNPELDAGSE